MTRLAPVPTEFLLEDLTWSLLIGSAVLLVAVAAVRISVRSGLPSLLIFLGIGLLLGESGLGITFDSEELTQVLGYSALVLILAEGGLTTRWSGIRRSVAPAAVLSTVGVVVSVGVVAVAARYVLQLEWPVALLIGAILSSTDAAAVFSVLRTVPLPRRLSGMLEAESGFNDAPVVILVVALAAESVPTAEHHPWWYLLIEAGVELVGGTVIGLRVGWSGAGCCGGSPGRRRPCSPSGSSAWSSSRTRSPPPHRRRASSPPTSRLWCSGTSACPTGPPSTASRRRSAPSPRSGCSSFSGCSPRPPQLPEQIVAAVVIGLVLLLRGAAAVRAGLADAVPDTAAGPGLPLVGRPARGRPIVLATVPATARHPEAPSGSSTSCSCSSSSSRWSRARPCRGWRDGWGCRVGQRGRARRGRPPPWRRWARRSSR